MTQRHPASRGAICLVLTAFTVIFTTLQWFGYTQKSATWDEPMHLATGYAAIARGDYRVEVTHPPFFRMWAALPLLFMRDVHLDTSVIDRTTPAAWNSGDTPSRFATQFLYIDNDADRLLNAARFMIVLCGVALGVLVFAWAYDWLGFVPAVCVLLFYTLSPTLLANTSVVTTDAGITCFIFGAVYWLWRTSRRFSVANVAGLTLCVALAVVTKFSALILGPLILVLLMVAVQQPTAVTARRAAALVVLLAVASWVIVWATYGFRYAPSPSPAWLMHLGEQRLARTVPTFTLVTNWIDQHRLLPNVFTEGFLMFAQSMIPPNQTFLAGAYSSEGWWYYFPVALLIKTPIAFLVLIAIGLVVCVQQRHRLGGINIVFVVAPILIYLVPALFNTYQVGIRHILPIYPFLLLITGAGVSALNRGFAGRLVVTSLAGFWGVMLASVYPYTLTFFNQLVGGPRHGHEYLTDSNIDWGQGLKVLKLWMDRHDVSRIGLAYFGSADPKYYGIDYTPLPAATPGFRLPSASSWQVPTLPGYVAVSATVLTEVYLDAQWRLFYRGLRHRAPSAVIGNSIYVYWLDRWPEATDAELTLSEPIDPEADRWLGDELLRKGWHDHSITHYHRYLRHHPNAPNVRTNIAAAYLAQGAAENAIPELERAVALSPDDGLAHWLLALAMFNAHRDITAVLAHARLAAALRPDDPQVLLILGRALAEHGELSEAATVVSRTLALAPDNDDARELLANIRVVAGRCCSIPR